MKDGFIQVAAATPAVLVADCTFNANQTIELMVQAEKQGVALVVFPELGLTAYTCADLFLQPTLLKGAIEALSTVVRASEDLAVVAVVGLPLAWKGKLYNCAAVVQSGQVLGVVPKTQIPNYHEFYESRWFVSAPVDNGLITVAGSVCPFGTDILFGSQQLENFIFAVEICEDLWVPSPPSVRHAQSGATILVNLSASDELVGKADYKRQLVTGQSARLMAAYIYAGAGCGESTTDMVFAGHDMIAENGIMLAESTVPFEGLVCTEVDVERLAAERRRSTTFEMFDDGSYDMVKFSHPVADTPLTRQFNRFPFVPAEGPDRNLRCKTILMIQSMGLVKRLRHTGTKRVVIGISGGLDSTLALLVAVEAFDYLGLPRSGIVAITMPCFGTTERTRSNAKALGSALGLTVREIDITASVLQHFADIGHDRTVHDVTFENSQARERTQVLMDVANSESALVVGTGDLSELALGWATYNGDHMSMYGVNASVPKTLIRHLVRYYVETGDSKDLGAVLTDVLDTPVSPELLPARDGVISQVTEEIVGPYELHDFFLYYAIRWGFGPAKVYRVAQVAFGGQYDAKTILTWLKVFYRRFFSQQFKRSCLPDGPKVGSVALSPRGDLRMPSDACVTLWTDELDHL
ncbi:MAG: NAD(+) synthase [Spirochaetae bacterium HGW-Spirochaetae-8]|nr:MAG: NAD(+) synthase [Spirochaetae bacterium HGW-Spirochaetae-8]